MPKPTPIADAESADEYEAQARAELVPSNGELFAVISQLQAIRKAANDPRGESLALLAARLDEAAKRLRVHADDMAEAVMLTAERRDRETVSRGGG